MREVNVELVRSTLEDMIIEAATLLPEDVLCRIEEARALEDHPLACIMLDQILDNAAIAADKGWPLCQDTGMAVVFMEIGQDVHLVGGSIDEAINEGVARAYLKGCLRKSVADPLTRQNTGDNTPAIIHYQIVAGENVTINFAPKGFGSENMSRSWMLNPTAGLSGIADAIVETVRLAGGKPCPPVVVGVGIGGTLEKAAILAKHSLLRHLAEPSADTTIAQLENDVLGRINELGIGVQGVGGRTTALAVHIETFPTHIAGLPVVVNIQCHSARHATRII